MPSQRNLGTYTPIQALISKAISQVTIHRKITIRERINLPRIAHIITHCNSLNRIIQKRCQWRAQSYILLAVTVPMHIAAREKTQGLEYVILLIDRIQVGFRLIPAADAVFLYIVATLLGCQRNGSAAQPIR